tara:strand:- start:58 stop:309 length:252 start_codon:yes stop_codon:yes gene_type:complete
LIDIYKYAKKVVQDAGLIDENDGHPDIHYRKIAHLLAEVERLRRRNEWLEEVVGLLQEEGVDLSIDGYPLWHEDGYMYWRNEE